MENKKKYFILSLVLISLAIFISYGITFAKYASKSIWNYYLDSKEFYLDSTELKSEGKQNINKIWNGESTHFNLKNSSNKSLVTDYDIQFTATCSVRNNENATCTLNGTDTNTYKGTLSSYEMCTNLTDDAVDVSGYTKSECETKSYQWTKKAADKDMFFDITGVEEGEEVIVDIEVVSTAPYKKTLTGEFHLKKMATINNDIKTAYNHYNDYDELIVTNSSVEDKCLSIAWESPSLRIDYDKDLIKSYKKSETGYINSIDILIGKQDSISYRFYKNDTKQYSIADFSLLEKTNC